VSEIVAFVELYEKHTSKYTLPQNAEFSFVIKQVVYVGKTIFKVL